MPTWSSTKLLPACFSTTIDPIAAKKEFRKTLARRQQTALEGGGQARLDAQVCRVHPVHVFTYAFVCTRSLLDERYLTHIIIKVLPLFALWLF